MGRMKKIFSAVVFDLDGTLIDSMPAVMEGFRLALEPVFPGISYAEISPKLGGAPEKTLKGFIGDEKKALEALRVFDGHVEDNLPMARPFEGVMEMLGELKRRGVKMGVWTGRDRRTTERLLELHGLGAFFEVVVCGDDFATHKPEPEGLMAVLGRLGELPVNALMVGDAVADVLGGQRAGCATMWIRSGQVWGAEVPATMVVELPTEACARVLKLVG